jgi:hypothetical protein
MTKADELPTIKLSGQSFAQFDSLHDRARQKTTLHRQINSDMNYMIFDDKIHSWYCQLFCVSRRNGVLVFCLKFSNVKTESMIRSILV